MRKYNFTIYNAIKNQISRKKHLKKCTRFLLRKWLSCVGRKRQLSGGMYYAHGLEGSMFNLKNQLSHKKYSTDLVLYQTPKINPRKSFSPKQSAMFPWQWKEPTLGHTVKEVQQVEDIFF